MAHETMSSGAQSGGAETSGMLNHAIYVPAGQDRFMEPFKVGPGIRTVPTDCKVATKDSNGAMYIFEHANMGKGGPPRHLHHEQDEWFYVIQGEFVFEVGDERFRMKQGDSLFAPRKVPHVWAHMDDTPGTLLVAVQPAGSFETFFHEGPLTTFEAHGMQVVGEPLPIG